LAQEEVAKANLPVSRPHYADGQIKGTVSQNIFLRKQNREDGLKNCKGFWGKDAWRL